jgi:hypothetical protein
VSAFHLAIHVRQILSGFGSFSSSGNDGGQSWKQMGLANRKIACAPTDVNRLSEVITSEVPRAFVLTGWRALHPQH